MNHVIKIMILCICLFVFGCNKQEEVKSSGHEEKMTAVELLLQRDFVQAEQKFKNNIDNKDVSSAQEACLGIILCHVLSNKYNAKIWEEWIPNNRLYWQGTCFSIGETCTTTISSEWISSQDKSLLLLEFLCNHNELWNLLKNNLNSFIQQYVAEKYQKLAWNFILCTGWKQLRKNCFSDSIPFFKQSLQYSLTEEQKEESEYGLSVANILLGKDMTCKRNTLFYRMELKKVSLFRNHSLLSFYAAQKSQLKQKDIQYFIHADLLYQLGLIASNPFSIWFKSMQWWDQCPISSDELSQRIKKVINYRFVSAEAWTKATSGHWKESKKIWDSLSNIDVPFRYEKDFAEVLYAWEMENSFDTVMEKIHTIHWNNYIWIAGRKFSFFRFPYRQKHKASYDRLSLERQKQLLIFDGLCILGDSRGAYGFLGTIIASLSDEEDKEIYSIEEENIPNDPYSENQIWETPD